MRDKPPPVLERGRILFGELSSDASYGMNGAFHVKTTTSFLTIIASDGVREGGGWEHVSVSSRNRTPRWNEMAYVKKLFWKPEEVVVEYHPADSNHYNLHPHCLHLWRCLTTPFPMPPMSML